MKRFAIASFSGIVPSSILPASPRRPPRARGVKLLRGDVSRPDVPRKTDSIRGKEGRYEQLRGPVPAGLETVLRESRAGFSREGRDLTQRNLSGVPRIWLSQYTHSPRIVIMTEVAI